MNTLAIIVIGGMVIAVLAGLWFLLTRSADWDDWDDFGGPYL